MSPVCAARRTLFQWGSVDFRGRPGVALPQHQPPQDVTPATARTAPGSWHRKEVEVPPMQARAYASVTTLALERTTPPHTIRDTIGWLLFRGSRRLATAAAATLGQQAPLGHVCDDLAAAMGRVDREASRRIR